MLVLVGAFTIPSFTLRVVWGIAVPLLPVTFLLSPELWRGVCPLATLNVLGNRLHRAQLPSTRTHAGLGIAGIGLFLALVPLRLVAFNTQGVAFAAAAAGVGVGALVLGMAFATRSGFCNGACPILPVERLYGQAPLLHLGRGRCDQCTVCTPRGCLDLAGDKAVAQLLGRTRLDHGWLGTSFGAFAAALPGFILGYYALPTIAAPSLLLAYGAPLAGALLSFLLVSAAVRVLRLSAASALVGLAAAAISLHYWFAGPTVAAALGLGSAAVWLVRVGAGAVIAVWTVRALRGRHLQVS